jgi:hypothetical protein
MNETLTWSFCRAPKPLTENNVVNGDCAQGGAAFETGDTVTASTPVDSCQLFGPEPPPGMFRPRDPDITGGFYQPILVSGTSDPVIVLERIRCDLARAPVDVATAFRMQYVPNANPKLVDVAAQIDGAPVPLDSLPPSRAVTLTASWTAASRESFVVYDLETASLATAEEALVVSWFASGGSFESGRTGETAAGGNEAQNRWTTPGTDKRAMLWVVLRDSRGGMDYRSYSIRIGNP